MKVITAIKTLRKLRRHDAAMYAAMRAASATVSVAQSPDGPAKENALMEIRATVAAYADAAERLGLPFPTGVEGQIRVLTALRARIPFFRVYSRFSKLS